RAPAVFALAVRGKPLEQRFDFVRLLGQFGPSRLGCGKGLARAVVAAFLDHAFVGEKLERRIDRTGAGRIGAAGQFLDRLDQLVAMARFVREQLQQGEAQLAMAEHPPPPMPSPAAAERPARTEGAVLTEWPSRAERPLGPERTIRSERRGPVPPATFPAAAGVMIQVPPSPPSLP